MSPDQHYQRAEQWLEDVDTAIHDKDKVHPLAEITVWLQLAQIHATLATVAGESP